MVHGSVNGHIFWQDIGVYDKVVIHQQSKTPSSYGNVQSSTLSGYRDPREVVPRSSYDTLPVKMSEATSRRGADNYHHQKHLSQGRNDVPPPLPPGRPDIPPPLPPGREEFSPPLPPEREDTPPPLPPGRPADQVDSGASMPGPVKGIRLPVSPGDLQKHVSDGPSKWRQEQKPHTLEKRDSGIASGDGTIRHGVPHHFSGDGTVRHAIHGSHHSINTSRSAPSSGDGEFGRRSRNSDRGVIDEGCPSSNDSTPNHSGGGTVQHGKSHLHFKCVGIIIA